MSNERRTNPRIPVALDAVVNYQTHAIICAIRDVSVGGAFIEAQPEELPMANAHVELGFSVTDKGGATRYYRVPSRIRRIHNDGAAIEFGDLEADAYFNLVDLVYQPQKRA
jgi:hypothetical protein